MSVAGPMTLTRRLRPATAGPFRALIRDVGADLDEITAALGTGKVGVPEWGGLMLEALAHAHAHAAYLGRLRAGDTAPFDVDDRRFGALVAQEEAPFLAAFEQDVLSGRYRGEDGALDVGAIARRGALYLGRIYGTANEALALTAGDEEWTWTLHAKESCEDCVALAAGSPYRGGPPPVLPRQNQTRCLQNCRCLCQSSSGLVTFTPEE